MQHVISQLKSAQIQAQKELTAATAALAALGVTVNGRPKRRVLSAKAIANISRAQKRRWAQVRREQKILAPKR